MVADTSDVAVVDTTAPDVELDITDESDAAGALETDDTAPQETEQPVAEPEERAQVNVAELLKELSDEDLEALEPVKSLVNRREFGKQRQTEAESARRLARQQDEWAKTGQWNTDLTSAFSVADGAPVVDAKKVNAVTSNLFDYSVRSTVAALGQTVDQIVSRDLQVPREMQKAIEDATHDFMLNPVQGKDALVRSWMDVVRLDAVEKAKADLEKEFRKKWEAEQKVTNEAKATARADQANAASGTATRVGGTSAGALNIQTWDDAVDAFTENRITAKQYGEFRKKFGKA